VKKGVPPFSSFSSLLLLPRSHTKEKRKEGKRRKVMADLGGSILFILSLPLIGRGGREKGGRKKGGGTLAAPTKSGFLLSIPSLPSLLS